MWLLEEGETNENSYSGRRRRIQETLNSIFVTHLILTLAGRWCCQSCLGKETKLKAQTLNTGILYQTTLFPINVLSLLWRFTQQE